MKIRIVNKSSHPLPAYETEHSAGMDLRAFTGGPVTLKPMERKLIPTGLYIELPVGERIPNGAPCYVTVDVDGLDPSTAPGVQWPLPGGLTFPEAARLLRGVATKGELVGIDVCEFAPSLDVRGLTALTIVRLLTNVLGAAARRSVGREPQW